MEISMIYIVLGATGEYSDRAEWVVKAFYSKKHAEEFCKMAKEIADGLLKEFEILRKNGDYGSDFLRKARSALDYNFQMDYTGTYYFIKECELE